jgi:hypothetical protein
LIDTALDDKFNSVSSFDGINDSLATVAGQIAQPAGKFNIVQPARLMLNVDRYIDRDFYINGEISINFFRSLAGNRKSYTREINLLTVTPRWETKRWGVYLPIQYNANGQFWIGGAGKAGPLLIGVHNWANVFAKNKMQNGGAYLALVVRSSDLTGHKTKKDRQYDCPK